jgi:hypothetical protein
MGGPRMRSLDLLLAVVERPVNVLAREARRPCASFQSPPVRRVSVGGAFTLVV